MLENKKIAELKIDLEKSKNIKEKQEKITLYNKKLKDDIITITQEKDKLEKLIKDKVRI